MAAQKLEKAQALLRISVAKGLKLKSGRDSKIALGTPKPENPGSAKSEGPQRLGWRALEITNGWSNLGRAAGS